VDKPNSESIKIYFAIFRKKIPEAIQRRFEYISQAIEKGYPEKEIDLYHKYLHKVSDLEALEIAMRCLNKLPILTDKFKVMVYLAETVPENYNVFVNEHTNRLTGFFLLLISLFRTGCKLVKGMLLLRFTNI
jgi:hypothetical protein